MPGVDDVGPRLRMLRLLQGLTLKQLAERAGLSLSYVSDLEHGRSRPSLATLERLAAALGVSRAELLGEDPAEPGPAVFAKAFMPGPAEPAGPAWRAPARRRARDEEEARYAYSLLEPPSDRPPASRADVEAPPPQRLSPRQRLAVIEALQALLADPEFGPEIGPAWRQLLAWVGVELAETAGRVLTKRELLEVYLVMRRVAGDGGSG